MKGKSQTKELRIPKPNWKKTFAIRKSKKNTDRMSFIIKKNGEISIIIEFMCNDRYNHETKWSSKLCRQFLEELRNDEIEVISCNGEKNSMSIKGRFFKNYLQYAWRIPEHLQTGENAIKKGDWVRIPYTNKGILYAYVDEVIPTYKLDFFPEKVIIRKQFYKNGRKLRTQKEYWQQRNQYNKWKKERKEHFKEMKAKANAETDIEQKQNELS